MGYVSNEYVSVLLWCESGLCVVVYCVSHPDQLFDKECWGSPVQEGACPAPVSMEQSNVVFEKAGAMLKGAFQHAHALGVKTAVGTETPLSKPPATHGQSLLNTFYSMSRNNTFNRECTLCCC